MQGELAQVQVGVLAPAWGKFPTAPITPCPNPTQVQITEVCLAAFVMSWFGALGFGA